MSSTTMAISKMDISHIRTKRFLFGLFSHNKSNCRGKGRRCYGQKSMCCSEHCKHIVLRSDRCT